MDAPRTALLTARGSASVRMSDDIPLHSHCAGRVTTPLHGRGNLCEFRTPAQHLRALHGPASALGFTGAIDCRARTQDPALEILGPVGQPGCFVDGIADDRVFVTVFRADVACEDGSGRHSDA